MPKSRPEPLIALYARSPTPDPAPLETTNVPAVVTTQRSGSSMLFSQITGCRFGNAQEYLKGLNLSCRRTGMPAGIVVRFDPTAPDVAAPDLEQVTPSGELVAFKRRFVARIGFDGIAAAGAGRGVRRPGAQGRGRAA